jgi:hypothetical protein
MLAGPGEPQEHQRALGGAWLLLACVDSKGGPQMLLLGAPRGPRGSLEPYDTFKH